MLSSHTFTIQRLQYLGHKYKCGLATADIRGKSSDAGCGYDELWRAVVDGVGKVSCRGHTDLISLAASA